MGIPSFYNKLLQTITGLITFKQTIDHDLLAFDANCVIYHIHKKLQNDGVFYDHTKHSEYEDLLIKETIKYFMTVISEVNPKKGVYIALDGVVPFAKILQQRRRRFKSVQTKKDENEIRKISKPFFDTNCITPGTLFMDKLNKALIHLSETSKKSKIKEQIPIFVSTSDEFGEGEQKVMEFLRCNDKIYKSFLIYGLDADLIILSMLHSIKHKIPINLVREECEFTPEGSFSKLTYLNNELLMNSLHSKYGNKDQTLQSFIYDFIGMMNLLGNDFVPHSYSLKIKDNGIETLLSFLQPITLKSKQTLLNEDFSYNQDILIELFETLAKSEEHFILKKIQTKSTRTAGFFCKSSDLIEKEISMYNDSPLVWKADELFVTSYSVDGKLKYNWNDLYNHHILYDNKEKAIDLYLESLAFTLDYYIGNPIDNDFYYPFFYSPLFSDLFIVMKDCKEKKIEKQIKHTFTKRSELKPIQQLVCVLPEDSFYLLPDSCKRLIKENPVYWPKSFDYFSIGKYYMYECEPIIPILHSSIVKKIFDESDLLIEKHCMKSSFDESESEIQPIPSMKKIR